MRPYHEVSNDHCGEKERDAGVGGTVYAVPHGLYPLATQDAEDDHERVKEVAEVPQRNSGFQKVLLCVTVSEQLHAHDGEYEDDDGEHEAEVAERAQSSADDAHQQVQCRPRLGQLKYPQLRAK